jgi:hypothetical protein
MNPLILFLLLIFTLAKPDNIMQDKPLSYLALGDSYTIGESVPLTENFPSHVVHYYARKELISMPLK